MKKRIGFIGLGIMGTHMATHLIRKFGHLNIINRNSPKTKKFKNKFKNKFKLFIYDKIDELARNSEIIISCVGNDNDLDDIFLKKNTILDNIKKNSLIIDHTTASVDITSSLYRHFKKKESFFFDAPVSGGEIGAKKGQLSIMVGGEEINFLKLQNILDCYSNSLIYMGNSGSGQLTKMVNQICVACVIQGLAEGLNFAKKKKLKIDNLIKVLSNGAGQSWQLENRSVTMWQNKFDFGFMNKLMLKDLNLVLNESKKSKIKLPTTKTIKEYYELLVKRGFSEEDTSNLIRLLK